jgi:hypothetical protein
MDPGMNRTETNLETEAPDANSTATIFNFRRTLRKK